MSDHALWVVGLGVAGEAGEVADAIKKVVGHGKILDTDQVAEETGDTLWYLAVLGYTIMGH